MTQPLHLEKALLQEIEWNDQGKVMREGRKVTVQFNPETLKVALSNQIAGGDQRGGGAIQFSGRGTTKLSFDLWFDVSSPQPGGAAETDVRRLTQAIALFLKPTEKGSGKKKEFIPPGVRFLWGTFLFEGVMESMSESLDLFSPDGKPLRSNLSISLTKQDVEISFFEPPPPSAGGTAPGTEPLESAREGESVQQVAARQGRPEDWRSIADANDVENPRRLPAGTPLRMPAR